MSGHQFNIDVREHSWELISTTCRAIQKQADAQGGSASVAYDHGLKRIEVVLYGPDLFKLAFEAAVKSWFNGR